MDKKGGFQAKLGLNWFTFALLAVGFAAYNFYSEYSYTGYSIFGGQESSGKPDLAVDRITATASRLSGEYYGYTLQIDYTVTILNRGNAASTQNFVVAFAAQIADAPSYGIRDVPNFDKIEPVNDGSFILNPRQKISKTFTQYLTSEQVPSTAKTLRVSTSALADQHISSPQMDGRGEGSVCTAEVELCNDRTTYVSRDPANNCQFRPCPAASCTDTDNGRSMDIKGTASGVHYRSNQAGAFTDTCVNARTTNSESVPESRYLHEYYCYNTKVTESYYTCPTNKICRDGACVSPPTEPVCAADVQQCNDGTYVSRDPANNCNFRACPTPAPGIPTTGEVPCPLAPITSCPSGQMPNIVTSNDGCKSQSGCRLNNDNNEVPCPLAPITSCPSGQVVLLHQHQRHYHVQLDGNVTIIK
ncbi:hypothetical protein HYT54_05470 [Candidatus Woesearchaeota archaeon]|nr:hypothetical protein [Candidatus Woesearchaeota archaeon]